MGTSKYSRPIDTPKSIPSGFCDKAFSSLCLGVSRNDVMSSAGFTSRPYRLLALRAHHIWVAQGLVGPYINCSFEVPYSVS